MNPEEIHRKKLKEIGYSDEAIEDIVERYIKNCVYEFAIAYHDEMSKYSQTPVSGKLHDSCRCCDGGIRSYTGRCSMCGLTKKGNFY